MGDAAPAPGAFALGVSRRLTAWIGVTAVIAIGLALWYLPTLAAIGVSLPIVWMGWRDVRLHALRAQASSLVALRCEAAGLAYALRQGGWINGKPRTGGLVHPWLTVVRLRDDAPTRKTRTLVLLPDALNAADFRHLRVHLAWRYREQKTDRAHRTDSADQSG